MGLHLHRATPEAIRWYEQYFGALVGATITGFELKKEEDDPEFPDYPGDEYWPTYTAKLADGSMVTLELSQDEEGNGPGWLFGLPTPPPIKS